jgi:putative ABC transport system substrate-binding protein
MLCPHVRYFGREQRFSGPGAANAGWPLLTHSGHRSESDFAVAKAGFSPYQSARLSRYDAHSDLGAARRRREFLGAVGGAVATWPSAVRAQQADKLRRVGFIWNSPQAFHDAMEAFRDALRGLGYVEGKTIALELRYAEGNPERMRVFAEELVRLQVDAIVAPSSIYTAAAKQATSTIPIVFMSHADPLGTGHVASLARPGGNITGLSLMMTETNVKLLELFKEAVPKISRAAVVFDPSTPSHIPGLAALTAAGPTLDIRIQAIPVSSASEYEAAFVTMVREGAEGALFLSTPLYIADTKRLSDLALANKLPSMFGPKQHVVDGGLISYSPDRRDLWRRGAVLLDKVLKGIKPADLPVEQPTKFELVINLRTARAIGVRFSEAFLARADEVIE